MTSPLLGMRMQYEAGMYPDPQKGLKNRSPRTIGGIIEGLYRGYNGSI